MVPLSCPLANAGCQSTTLFFSLTIYFHRTAEAQATARRRSLRSGRDPRSFIAPTGAAHTRFSKIRNWLSRISLVVNSAA
ncbi:hypothetical protein ACINKY_17375 [Paenibacillus illinoisensis]|uniref:Secreted protein n=1 Tax=Paenibacillus illinoisensis TaxID=59845 RepID=A0ABW8HWF9_9BACL